MGPEGGGRAAPRTSSLDGLGPFPTWSEPCLSCRPAPSHGSRQRPVRPVRGRGARRVRCAPAATPRPGRPRPVLPLTELPGLEGNGELAGQGLAEETPHRPPKAASVRGPGCVSLRWTGPSARLAGGGRAGPESAKNPASDLTHTRVSACTPTHPRPLWRQAPITASSEGARTAGTRGHRAAGPCQDARTTAQAVAAQAPGPGGPAWGRVEPPATPVPSASVPSPGPSRGRAPRQPSVPLSRLAALPPRPLRACPGHPRRPRAGPGLAHALSSRLCLACRVTLRTEDRHLPPPGEGLTERSGPGREEAPPAPPAPSPSTEF